MSTGKLLALAACVGLAACSRKEAGPAAAVKEGGGMAVYEERERLFTCEVPAGWRVMEDQGGGQRVSFFGPPSGPKPYSSSIAFYYFPKAGSDYKSPQDYFSAQQASGSKTTPLEERSWKDRKVLEFTTKRRQPLMHAKKEFEDLAEETILIPVKDGFVAVVHSASADAHDKTEPVFRSVLDTLRLRL